MAFCEGSYCGKDGCYVGFLGEVGAGAGDRAEFKVFDAIGVEVG